MDDEIATFLAFTGTENATTAKHYLDLTGNNIEYAVQLFMESGNTANSAPAGDADEEIAQRMQQEAYQENVREADTNVHRHETLLDSFGGFPMPQARETDIFGHGRVGVFDQRFDVEDDIDDVDYDVPQIEELDDDDSSSLDEIVEINQPRRARLQNSRLAELTSTQRRLALLFKPPFDLIERTNLDGAKQKGRAEQKWILVNIQDQTEFQCQVLNRDFWTNAGVKQIVHKHFIFLQYQHDSPNGQSYLNFYSVDGFPHISILDPMTGERVYKAADGQVPDVEEWLADVELFLEKFSLHPESNNPMVQHEARFDPDAMSEEQQIEFALKQSIANAGTTAEDAIAVDEIEPTPEITADPFESIQPQDHAEPAAGSVTRIQIRFPNGKRLIHKFDFECDSVLTIFQYLKYVLVEADEAAYGIGLGDKFSISSVGKRLIDCLDMTVGDAGLKNASILLEKE